MVRERYLLSNSRWLIFIPVLRGDAVEIAGHSSEAFLNAVPL